MLNEISFPIFQGEVVDAIGGIAEAVVTWVLVVVGWIVVNDQNRHQEIARANHQRLNVLRALLDDIEQCALTLHCDEYDETQSRRVRRLLKKAAIDCKLLAECGAMDSAWSSQMIKLRQAITLQNFDRSGFRRQASGSPILAAIESAKDSFEAYIATHTKTSLLVGRSVWTSIGAAFGVRR